MNYRAWFVSFCVVALGACASSTPRSLLDARAAYQRASQGPAARLTPAQLHVAQVSLTLAEKTYDEEGDSANAKDRAYVAQRKAELAEIQAGLVAAQVRAQLAEQRIGQAKLRQQQATQQDLTSTRAQLANEKQLLASQQAELESERQRRLEAERKAEQAMAQLASIASVKQESRGTVITLSGAVIFASGKSELLPSARAKLDQVATALKESEPGTRFIVEGHTDSRGGAAMNQDLRNDVRRLSVNTWSRVAFPKTAFRRRGGAPVVLLQTTRQRRAEQTTGA
ncbi:MAG: DUF4398 domain-containing protein [Polyangiaceae bacterium]